MTWVALAAALLVGCGGGEPTPEVRADTYEVRGEVVSIDADAQPKPQIRIRHEAIPDYRNRAGETVGMGVMAMPAFVEAEVDLSGIEPGDKVAFTLRQQWEPRIETQITAIETLPADTELELGDTAEMAGGDHGAHDHGDHEGHDH
jgi:Cu/Ag efflux protein CusF